MEFKEHIGFKSYNRFPNTRQARTIHFDTITEDSNTVVIDTGGVRFGHFFINNTDNATLEFQGALENSADDKDWINLDSQNRTFDHTAINNKESYQFTRLVNYLRVKLTGVTGTVDIKLMIGGSM